MESADEELSAVLQCHQNSSTTDVSSLAGVVSGSSSSSSGVAATSLLATGASAGGGRGFREGPQHSFSSERRAMLGSTRPYNDSSGHKSSMSVQIMNPFQEQGGQSFGSSAAIPPKNGVRRQGGLWSGGGGHRNNFVSQRNGEPEMDPRLQVPDYPSAVLDQSPIPMPDPFRASGGLARYHSAPSSFLAGLADFHQDSALSSFFSDADLPPLNPASDSSMDNMDTEQVSTSLFDDKFLLDTRKFERIGNPQLGPGGGGGLVSQKSLQSSVYKPSMEVLHENTSVSAQVPSSSQVPNSMASGLCLPSTMGLVQQVSNSQAGQQMNLGNFPGNNAQAGQQMNLSPHLTGNMNYSCGLGSDFGGGVSPTGATLGGLSSSGRSNSLLRQSSSPAGLLAQLTIDVSTQLAKNEKPSLSSPLAQSPDDSLSGGTSEDNSGGTHGMISGLDVGGWEDASSYMKPWGNDAFSARKRFRDNMDLGDMIVPSESPGSGASLEHGPVPGSLTRHMSLPSSKSKISVSPDDLLQSVPCRIRAKRGCATHPRSIAERVRRTRISERMRKLQELVPNMDKQQTNTADMLDEAVEYVKQLQRQVQELTESQAKCNGSCHQDLKKIAS